MVKSDRTLITEIIRLLNQQRATLSNGITAVEACQYVERGERIKLLVMEFLATPCSNPDTLAEAYRSYGSHLAAQRPRLYLN